MSRYTHPKPRPGRKPGSGKGRISRSSSITLKPDEWAKLDTLRGNLNRSKWIAGKINEL